MRFYIASRYSRHPEMRDHAVLLREAGHTVTSRWIEGDHSLDESLDRGQADEVRANFAIEDIEDLTKSDCVLSFTEKSLTIKGRPSKGGRHVEFGVGLALNKRLMIVGPREHVFHWLPSVEQYESVSDMLATINDERNARD